MFINFYTSFIYNNKFLCYLVAVGTVTDHTSGGLRYSIDKPTQNETFGCDGF